MSAEHWILVVWAIGLAGALPPTIIILKEVRLVLATLRDIRLLADRTAAAGRGIARHVEPIAELPAALGGTDALRRAGQRLRSASSGFAGSIDSELGGSVTSRFAGWLIERLTGRKSS